MALAEAQATCSAQLVQQALLARLCLHAACALQRAAATHHRTARPPACSFHRGGACPQCRRSPPMLTCVSNANADAAGGTL